MSMKLLSVRDACPQVLRRGILAAAVLVAVLMASALAVNAAEDDVDCRGKQYEAFKSAMEKRVEKLHQQEKKAAKAKGRRHGGKPKKTILEEKRSRGERAKLEKLLRDLSRSGTINPTSIAVVDDDFVAVARATSTQIEAPDAHERATGRGVTIAVLDGGFNTAHPMIAGRISAYGFDAIDLDFNPNDDGDGKDGDLDGQVDEGLGHGTFVAGMVLQAAPNATIIPVRVADDEGYAASKHIAAGIEYAIKMKVDVINLSLQAGERSESIGVLLDRATKAGIVIVGSAGNDGKVVDGLIAERKDTICVGAVDKNDVIAGFSNFSGKKVELTVFAPGVGLYGPVGWPARSAMGLGSGTSCA